MPISRIVFWKKPGEFPPLVPPKYLFELVREAGERAEVEEEL
jgi:hypothetical protein